MGRRGHTLTLVRSGSAEHLKHRWKGPDRERRLAPCAHLPWSAVCPNLVESRMAAFGRAGRGCGRSKRCDRPGRGAIGGMSGIEALAREAVLRGGTGPRKRVAATRVGQGRFGRPRSSIQRGLTKGPSASVPRPSFAPAKRPRSATVMAGRTSPLFLQLSPKARSAHGLTGFRQFDQMVKIDPPVRGRARG